MITVKMLKPYYIKANDKYIRVVLAYQYFSVFINKQVYHFIPAESNEIRINRHTKKIENTGARFAFQKGKDIVHMAMTELISLPDFLVQLHAIVAPYFKTDVATNEYETLIDELEYLNVKRLIDKALDERNEEQFYELLKLL